jgi:branched-subunit amino acid aminotransferase/4-amino-4-deoxychorismate lyase
MYIAFLHEKRSLLFEPKRMKLHVLKEGSIESSIVDYGVEEYLLMNPNCPYTTFRTLSQGYPQLKEHFERLKHGSLKLHQKELIWTPLDFLKLDFIGSSSEIYIFILIVTQEMTLKIYQKLFTEPAFKITCKLAEFEREQPEIKQTNWVRQRKAIPVKSDEILLTTNGTIKEGMITNFFGVVERKGVQTLITCDFKHVLKGTIANLIIELCIKNNIPYYFDYPDPYLLKGAFVTNSLRWVQFVEKVIIDEKEILFDNTLEIIRIIQMLLHDTLFETRSLLIR